MVINGPASAAGDCDGRNPGSKLTNIQHFRVYFGRYDGAVQCPAEHATFQADWADILIADCAMSIKCLTIIVKNYLFIISILIQSFRWSIDISLSIIIV